MIKLNSGSYQVKVEVWMTDKMKPYYNVCVNDVLIVSTFKYERAREICFGLIEGYKNAKEVNKAVTG